MKKITQVEINAIHNFIRSAIYDFRELGCENRELIIVLPSWLKQLLRSFPMREYGYIETLEVLKFEKFFDIPTQSHFKDEVVIFYENYHQNPDRFTPAIHVINFEES